MENKVWWKINLMMLVLTNFFVFLLWDKLIVRGLDIEFILNLG